MLWGKQAVIFDLDGTLLDTMGVWILVDQRLLRQLNGPILSDREVVQFREKILKRYALSENPYEELCSAWGNLCQSSLSARDIHALRFQISRQLLKNDVRARSGIRELIQYLKLNSLTLAIATCTKRANVDLYAQSNALIRQSLDLYNDFSLILTRDDITHIKPDPEIYQLTLQRLGLAAQACIVVEDSLEGILAAQAAGIDTIAIQEKHSALYASQIKARSNYYFESFEALLSAIHTSFNQSFP